MDTVPSTDQNQASFNSGYNIQLNNFSTINKIFELQSIINQLSIQKQKNQIALSSNIKNHSIELNNLISQISQQKLQKMEIFRQLQSSRKQIDIWKKKYEVTKNEKEQIQQVLNRAPIVENKMSINLLISEYQKLKLQVQSKDNQNEQMRLRLRQYQNLLMQAKLQINILKQSLEQQVSQIDNQFQEQKNILLLDFNRLSMEHRIQKQGLLSDLRKLNKDKRQMQSENDRLISKIQQMRQNMNEQHRLYIQAQLQQLQGSLSGGVRQQIYQQLKEKYNSQLEEKNNLTLQLSLTTKQSNNLRNTCTIYNNEIKILQERLNQKIYNEHKIQQLVQFNIIEVIKKQPSDELAKLQQITHLYKKQKKQMQDQLTVQRKKTIILQQKIQQMKKEKQVLQKINIIQKSTRIDLQKKLLNSNQKFMQIQAQNKRLKVKNDQLIFRLQQTQLLCRRHQFQYKEADKVAKNSQQNYEKLIQSYSVLGNDKSSLVKQVIRLKQDLQKSQEQIIKISKSKNQMQYQVKNKSRIIQKLQARCIELAQAVQKAQQSTINLSHQYSQQREQMTRKLNIMDQCVTKLKQERTNQEKQHFIKEGRKRRLFIQYEVYDIKIKPSLKLDSNKQTKSQHKTLQFEQKQYKLGIRLPKELQKSKSKQKQKQKQICVEFSRNSGKEKLTNPLQFENKQKQITTKQREKVQNYCKLKIKKINDIYPSRQLDKDQEKLDRMIKKLKTQNRQLSKGRLK